MSSINKKLANPKDSFGLSGGQLARSALKRNYTIPPFSVLNTRDGDWQERRRAWLALGIQSELGREVVTYNTKHLSEEKYGKGKQSMGEISIFDPVLCEFIYTFFCPPNGQVVDPFAGGSVRGVTASVLGLQYWGCDLSKRQIRVNREQLTPDMMGDHIPEWLCGDSRKELTIAPKCDLFFSCPPYSMLEVYSDDPKDISNMPYSEFLEAYSDIIQKGCKKLRDQRFACFVVASFRDKKTHAIYDLPGDTIRAFQKAGLVWYDDLVLVNQCGTGPIRAKTLFENGRRKVVKLHQNVLVFAKGKPPAWDWSN